MNNNSYFKDIIVGCNELLTVSKCAQCFSNIINQVKETSTRRILTLNGVPVAAIVPLSMLGQISNG